MQSRCGESRGLSRRKPVRLLSLRHSCSLAPAAVKSRARARARPPSRRAKVQRVKSNQQKKEGEGLHGCRGRPRGLAWVRRLRSGHRPTNRLPSHEQPVAPPLATCRGARQGLDWPWADDGRMTCFHLPLAVRGRAACQDPRVCRLSASTSRSAASLASRSLCTSPTRWEMIL